MRISKNLMDETQGGGRGERGLRRVEDGYKRWDGHGSPAPVSATDAEGYVSRGAQPGGAELRATPSQKRRCLVVISMMIVVMIVITIVRLARITNDAMDGQGSEMPGRRSLTRESQGHVRKLDLRPSGNANLQGG
jgi:hypothetical protein